MIYLDNAATTLIKPYAVINTMNDWMNRYCANPGRSGHRLAINASEKVYECRELLARLFNISRPESIIFTANTTMALNTAIQGYVCKNSHIVISGMEHNSVYRTVVNSGCEYTIAEPDETGYVSVDSIENALQPNTSLIIIIHASNVVGTINPIKEIGELAKQRGIPMLVDAAQTAGVLDIDVVRDNISMLAFAGHKMLLGPTGTGGLYISPAIEISPLIFGGTGSASESPYQPEYMPDKYESGTLNIVGIAGLAEGVKYILKNTTQEIHRYEKKLAERLAAGLYGIKRVKVYGNTDRVGVVSFATQGYDSVYVSNMLSEMSIASRGGLHCAPLAHKSLGTQNGLTRLSVSCFNTAREIDAAIDAVYRISK